MLYYYHKKYFLRATYKAILNMSKIFETCYFLSKVLS